MATEEFVMATKEEAEAIIKEFTSGEGVEETIKKLEEEIADKKARLAKLRYIDEILRNENDVSEDVVAAHYGLSAEELNSLLQERVKLGQGVLEFSVVNKPHRYWTQEGRMYLYEILSYIGILPLIEKESKD